MSVEPFALRDEFDAAYLVRPDGGRLIVAGWIFIAIALLAWIVALLIPTVDFMDRYDPKAVADKVNLVLAGGAFGAAGFALLIGGYMVRALYFLHGDPMKARGSTLEAREKRRLNDKALTQVQTLQSAAPEMPAD